MEGTQGDNFAFDIHENYSFLDGGVPALTGH